MDRLEDDPHPAGAKPFDESIVADLLRLSLRRRGAVKLSRRRELLLQMPQMLGQQLLRSLVGAKSGDEGIRIRRAAGAHRRFKLIRQLIEPHYRFQRQIAQLAIESI